MLKFISLGSGSSGNCYYFAQDNDAMLIDAGVGIRNVKKFLHDKGISIDSINRILITHDHADHIKSVGVISSEYDIPVYATSDVHDGIMRNYCVPKKIPDHNRQVIEKNVRKKLGNFYVTPFAVPHDSSGNVGYKIEVDNGTAEGLTFCIMTDVGHVTEEMQQYIGEANYLVIEANYDKQMLKNGPYPQYLKARIESPTGHLSNYECGEAIANFATQKLKRVWMCHLSEENNHPILALKTVEQVLRTYGLVAQKDFIVEDLKRKLPSELYELL